jgi:hypothetical protein
MIFPESLLVVLACTLSGGLERHASTQQQAGREESCGQGTRWEECGVLDGSIQTAHLAFPWLVTLGCIVFLSMPTVLLRSRSKERGLSTVAWNLFQCLALMLCSCFVTDHPSIQFTVTLHSCILLLGHMNVSDSLVGGGWWWALRHVVALGILVWEIALGPAVSVVRWPSTPAGPALPCAYLAHLAGSVIPDCVLLVLQGVLQLARSTCLRDD